jgi:hypothetical protein
MQILHGLEAGWCVPLRTKRAKLELRFKLIKCKLEGPVILPPACETVLKVQCGDFSHPHGWTSEQTQEILQACAAHTEVRRKKLPADQLKNLCLTIVAALPPNKIEYRQFISKSRC